MSDEEIIEGINEILKSQENLEEYSKDKFEACDKDQNGQISFDELEKCLLEMAEEMKTPKPTEEFVKKILSQFDKDKSGKLEPAEFTHFSKVVLENLLKKLSK